jgi:S-methylmethionine-dependent homocysteine/selenocysteine methylase
LSTSIQIDVKRTIEATLSGQRSLSVSSSWLDKIQNDEIVLIDGATGTELQRRGVPMDEIAWSGAAVLSHPTTVRETHEDYIRMGAEVVIANTFGSTRQMLQPAGYADQVETVNRRAIELAMEARENVADHPVAVAGSIAAMPPAFDRNAYWPPAAELESYREAARIQVEAGADLIALEMLEDTEHAPLAFQAAQETGVPIWLGLSCKRRKSDHRLTSFGYDDLEFEDVLEKLIPLGPTIVNIMHSEVHLIPDALQLVRQHWNGAIGVYPESGYFTRPHWNFVDVIDPTDLVQEALGWVAAGVRLLGGCCGTNPDHVRALRDAMPELTRAKVA